VAQVRSYAKHREQEHQRAYRLLVKNLCIICRRNCNVGHALLSRSFARVRYRRVRAALCGLPLAGVARHGVAVVNVRMLLWSMATLRAPSSLRRILPSAPNPPRSKFTIGNLQLIVCDVNGYGRQQKKPSPEHIGDNAICRRGS